MKLITRAIRPGTACRTSLWGTQNSGINSSRASSIEATKTEHEALGQKNEGEHTGNAITPDPFHIDHVNRTVTTATGVLPLSPVMDPSFHKARGQYTAEAKKKALSFDQKAKIGLGLERNIYAQALATPARACGVTGIVLPNYFHLKFKAVKNPEKGSYWFVPNEVSLKSDGLSYQEIIPGSGMHTICQQQLLREFFVPKGKYTESFKALSSRDTTCKRIESGPKTPFWRPDMDLYILELLRGHITQCLIRFAGMVETADRTYLIKCDRWEDASQHDLGGCLLYIGEDGDVGGNDGQISGNTASTTPVLAPPPARLSMMELKDAKRDMKIAIHDLRVLLGEGNVARLRERKALFRDGSLFLVGGKRTKKLQMQLWRLQGYMGAERPSDPEVPAKPEARADSEVPVDPEAPIDSQGPTDPKVPVDSETPAEPEVPADAVVPVDSEGLADPKVLADDALPP